MFPIMRHRSHITFNARDMITEQPVIAPVEPVENTLRQLTKASDAMTIERDELDRKVRQMAERSRQLTVSIGAVQRAMDELYDDAAISAVAKEVVNAEGH